MSTVAGTNDSRVKVKLVKVKFFEGDVEEVPKINLEEEFRERLFDDDASKILNVDLRCTVCGRGINWMLLLKKQILIHPELDVLLCEGCLINVNSSNPGACCLWCGSEPPNSPIFECDECHKKFCSSCIQQNFGNAMLGRMQLGSGYWKCFMCFDNTSGTDYGHESVMVLRALCDAAQKMCVEMTKMDEKNTENDTATDCVICTEEFDPVAQLKCKHKFHKSCINEWMKKNRSCPICRSSYVEVNSPTL